MEKIETTENKIHQVKDFDFDKYTFKCPNNFEDSPMAGGIGNAKNGLCGGMALAAIAFYCAKKTIPQDTTPPSSTHESALFEYLKECQMESCKVASVLSYGLGTFSDSKNDKDNTKQAWKNIEKMICENQPVLIGLIRNKSSIGNLFADLFKGNINNVSNTFTQHHQVVVHGYEIENNCVTFSVYDPAQPGEKNVKIAFNQDGSDIKHFIKTDENNILDLGTVYSFFKPEYDLRKVKDLPLLEADKNQKIEKSEFKLSS